ncbi:MAG: DUF1800 domain-containing protein [Gemmatimonadaceae bacterium]|nr:DUF1800 domain-containing protein [Gemmatimonadaceae bacterium]
MRSTSRSATLALVLALAACSSAQSGTGRVATASSSGELAQGVREQTADEQVKQALNRVSFGARPGDAERVRAMGVDKWIELQLSPGKIDDRSAEQFVAKFPVLAMSPAQLLQDYPQPNQLIREKRREMARNGETVLRDSSGSKFSGLDFTAADSARYKEAGRLSRQMLVELQTAKVARAVIGDRQLEEVMVDFWENHFTVFAGKGPERYFLGQFERDAIRPHALGKFRDLLGAVAKSPAMLYYLDNWESTVEADRPSLVLRANRGGGNGRGRTAIVRNARLEAMGKDTTKKPRARGLNENYGRELLELHTLGVDGGYTQADVVSAARAFTGWTVEKPREDGSFAFRPALHDAGAKSFLGHTLAPNRGIEDGEQVLDIVATAPAAAHFVATKLVRRFVSDSVPAELVDRVANTFTRTDGDIRECLRTIFTSSEFFSRAAYKAKVKSPFELVVSALRVVGARADSTPRTAQMIAKLGQPLYGHLAPNGYPERGDAWINTGAILARINFGLVVASGKVPGASLAEWTDGAQLQSLPHGAQVDGIIRSILGGEASPDTRRVLESGVNPMASDSASAATKLTGFENIVGLALGAPEFQRR